MEASAGLSVVLVCADAAGSAAALGVAGVTLVARTAQAGAAARLVARHRPQVAVVDLDSAGPAGQDAIAGSPGCSRRRRCSPSRAWPITPPSSPRCARAPPASWSGRAVLRCWSGPCGGWRRGKRCSARASPGSCSMRRSERPAPAVLARLTERESDVLRLVVEGLTGRQIAARLVLSPRTVENHVQHLLRKLDLPNRAALVRFAIEQGLA